MQKKDELSPQKKASNKQNEKRKGSPCFAAIRVKDSKKLKEINKMIADMGFTREATLIKAFEALARENKANKINFE